MAKSSSTRVHAAVQVRDGQFTKTMLLPLSSVGSVARLVGFGGSMGGVVFNLVAGFLLDNGYGLLSETVTTFHVLAFCVMMLAVRRVKPLALERKL
jgi:ACS family hexuronate transporter-like MFS transporter